MPNGRLLVQPPAFTPAQYGLLTVAQDASAGAESHWRAGITYQSVCSNAQSTYDECLVVTGVGAVAEPPVKVATTEHSLRGATPFTVYAEIDCAPNAAWDSIQAEATEALVRSEQWQVERAVATGVVGGAVVMFPHLAANTILLSDGALLQSAAVVVTGATLDVVEGLGRLEADLADCYHGQGVIHVPVELLPAFIANDLITARAGIYTTAKGNRVIIGDGYTGTSPAGAVTAGALWIYATGAMFYYRENAVTFRREDSFDRSVNTVKAIAERTYVVGWDCCHLAVPISTGGVVTGVVNSAS